jgi:predicted XRE-type DNA-binding protein
MDVTPQCIEVRTQIAFAIYEWFHASKMTIEQAAKQMRLPPSAACDVLNLHIHGMTIDRLLRTWTYIGGTQKLVLDHPHVKRAQDPMSHRLVSHARYTRGRPPRMVG